MFCSYFFFSAQKNKKKNKYRYRMYFKLPLSRPMIDWDKFSWFSHFSRVRVEFTKQST